MKSKNFFIKLNASPSQTGSIFYKTENHFVGYCFICPADMGKDFEGKIALNRGAWCFERNIPGELPFETYEKLLEYLEKYV